MRPVVLALCAFFAVASATSFSHYSRQTHYEGHKVYLCHFDNANALSYILRAVDEFGFDVWKQRSNEIEIRLTPEQQVKFHGLFKRCEVIIEDVELIVREWETQMLRASKKGNAEWFEEYHTYEELVDWYQSFAASNPSLVTYTASIGSSFEGRAQPSIKVTSLRGSNKPKIYLQCQIHAREWISSATCNYVINKLVSRYGNSTETALLDSVEIHLVPFVNPDGYSYTWTNDRLWRKNRNTNNGNVCKGVDLNRNYNSHWASGGSSGSPCSDTYYGVSANSEVETKNTINKFKSVSPVVGAIDWHSYSQLILRPWGWTRADSPDEGFLSRVGNGIRDAIRTVNGVAYTSQKSIDLYVTTGTASDWFYDDEATATNGGYRAAGFTIELRDTGRYGFELPPEQIIPTGEENYAGFIYFAQQVLNSPIQV